MTTNLEAIAEGDCHARWIVERHIGNGAERERCTICEQWWPCDLVGLGALAILNAERAERAEAEKERLRAALIEHGEHRPRCARKRSGGTPCDCGLGAMLADCLDEQPGAIS